MALRKNKLVESKSLRWRGRERLTLKVILAFTFSPSTVAMLWSKFCMMRMASWGSMRRLPIRSSSVSARARPMLRDG